MFVYAGHRMKNGADKGKRSVPERRIRALSRDGRPAVETVVMRGRVPRGVHPLPGPAAELAGGDLRVGDPHLGAVVKPLDCQLRRIVMPVDVHIFDFTGNLVDEPPVRPQELLLLWPGVRAGLSHRRVDGTAVECGRVDRLRAQPGNAQG